MIGRSWFALGLALSWSGSLGAAPPASVEELFTPTRVWTIHITASPEEWSAIEPTRRPGTGLGFRPPMGPPPPPAVTDRPVSVSPFGIEYPYIRAEVDFDGAKLANVGLRFKGNSSFVAARELKRPLKIDFDRWVDGQTFLGLAMLNFSNNTMDPSQLRERMAYAVFRDAGVPAPRTAYARIYLTVPGQYERTLMGLYTIVEPVDKPFLKDRFGAAGGMLLKPERASGLPHCGDDWSAYSDRYRPKKEPNPDQGRRLIELTRLIHHADDAEFHRRIPEFIDVDALLRLAAANSAITNLDSFFGTGHNYYFYLHPATNLFHVIPWDLDHSFGGFGMAGSPEQMMEWTIRKPYLGDHRLVARLLAEPDNEAKFRGYLKSLTDGPLQPERMRQLICETEAAIRPAMEEESAAQAGGLFGFGFGRFITKPPDVAEFIARRHQSIVDQLDGKSEGQQLRFGGRRPEKKPEAPKSSDDPKPPADGK